MTDLTPVAPWRRLQLPNVIAALACLRPFYNSVDVFSLSNQISVTTRGRSGWELLATVRASHFGRCWTTVLLFSAATNRKNRSPRAKLWRHVA